MDPRGDLKSGAHALEATYLRTALLLGVVRCEAVNGWAAQVIECEAEVPEPFFDLISVPVGDLSGLRHALWPLVIDPEPAVVRRRLFGLLHDDLVTGRRSLSDTLTIVRQMRSMLRLPADVYASVNAGLVAFAEKPVDRTLAEWLRDASQPGGLVSP